MKNIEKYQQIFLEQFPISVSDLNEEYTRESEDLWDDFASLAMCLAMDVEFGVHISDEDIYDNFDGYMKGIEILKKYGVDFGV